MSSCRRVFFSLGYSRGILFSHPLTVQNLIWKWRVTIRSREGERVSFFSSLNLAQLMHCLLKFQSFKLISGVCKSLLLEFPRWNVAFEWFDFPCGSGTHAFLRFLHNLFIHYFRNSPRIPSIPSSSFHPCCLFMYHDKRNFLICCYV